MRKLLIGLFVIPFVLFTGFTIRNNKLVDQKKAVLNEYQAQLLLLELNNPIKYLKTEVVVKPNLVVVKKESLFNDTEYINDGYLIEGTINNNADWVNFKDVVFRVNFYAANKAKVGSKDYVFHEYYKPHTDKKISLKVYPPEGYIEFGFEIVKASGFQ